MKIAIVAGEASGDALGADLMSRLDANFEGVGGRLMAEKGLDSLFPMEELSVMGVIEVLPKARRLLSRVRQTAEFVLKGEFDALITIDSPDFSHRVAKKVKAERPSLPVIHYVAPSVWAWREGRAKKMARYVDHVLCLLPFEPPLMEEAGMSADFVGHPVSRRSPPKTLKNWMKNNPNVIGIFPGSRRSEIKNHIRVYAEFAKQRSGVKFCVPTADHLFQEVSDAFSNMQNVRIISPKTCENFEDEKQNLVYGADFAICTSGTISFELAWADTNTLVCYRTNMLNEFLYKRMIKVNYASLANILLGYEVIPELLFEQFSAENLGGSFDMLMNDQHLREEQKARFKEMREIMVPGIDAAASVGRFLQSR